MLFGLAAQPAYTRIMDDGGPGADWRTIWASEMAALATDRELAETWQAAAALWEAGFRAMAALTALDGPAGGSWPEPPARPAAPVAAPDAAERMEQLARRVEALERRLAGLGELPLP